MLKFTVLTMSETHADTTSYFRTGRILLIILTTH